MDRPGTAIRSAGEAELRLVIGYPLHVWQGVGECSNGCSNQSDPGRIEANPAERKALIMGTFGTVANRPEPLLDS